MRPCDHRHFNNSSAGRGDGRLRPAQRPKDRSVQGPTAPSRGQLNASGKGTARWRSNLREADAFDQIRFHYARALELRRQALRDPLTRRIALGFALAYAAFITFAAIAITVAPFRSAGRAASKEPQWRTDATPAPIIVRSGFDRGAK